MWHAGTLTCNMMEFAQCSIAGVKYGTGFGLPPSQQAAAYQETSFNFYDK